MNTLLIAATLAVAAGAHSNAHVIDFYGDVGNVVSSRNPLLVRPDTLLLAEDGSTALVHLRWVGWGTRIARGTGTWSASDCTPSCATGKRTTAPAHLTLYSPGCVKGHQVYRCFRVTVPSRARSGIQECLQRQGNFYLYVTDLETDRKGPGALRKCLPNDKAICPSSTATSI